MKYNKKITLKHTKSPWWYSSNGEILKMPEQIKISNYISGETYEAGKANGQLISYAPEFLDFCIKIVATTSRSRYFVQGIVAVWDEALDLIKRSTTLKNLYEVRQYYEQSIKNKKEKENDK